MTTGEKIKNIRQNAGLTQEQLAEKLSVSRQAIAKWEADRGIPDIENLKTISVFFNLSVDDLLNPDFEVTQSAASEEAQNAKASKKFDFKKILNLLKTKKVLLPLISGLTALVLIFVLFQWIIPAIKRNNALNEARTLMSNGEYSAAADIFYEVSSDEYEECMYLYAKELHSKGNYEEAISTIGKILYYNDAPDLFKSWGYEYALYNVKQEKYLEAAKLFEDLGEYNGSDDKSKELYYYLGCKAYNDKDYMNAASYFGKYDKNNDNYKTAVYNYGVQLFTEGKYGLAFNELNSLVKSGSNFKDTAAMAKIVLTVTLLGGIEWTKTTSILNDNGFHFDSYFLFTSNETQTRLTCEETGDNKVLTAQTKIYGPSEKEGCPTEVFVGSLPPDNTYWTFDFTSNNKVYTHMHNTSDKYKCGDLCGTYTAKSDKWASVYAGIYKLTPISKTIEIPTLSFIKELPDNKTPESNVNSSPETPQNNEENSSETSSDENTSSSGSSSSNTESSGSTGSSSGTNSSSSGSSGSSTGSSGNSGGSTSSSGNSGGSSAGSSSSSTSSSGSGSSTNTNPCANGHSWIELTKTVHHDEVGHYEQVQKSKKVTNYKCAVCYNKFNSLSEYYTHFEEHLQTSNSNVSLFRERYETVDGYEYYYEQEWVVDTKAYDETVVTGHKCSVCGTTK